MSRPAPRTHTTAVGLAAQQRASFQLEGILLTRSTQTTGSRFESLSIAASDLSIEFLKVGKQPAADCCPWWPHPSSLSVGPSLEYPFRSSSLRNRQGDREESGHALATDPSSRPRRRPFSSFWMPAPSFSSLPPVLPIMVALSIKAPPCSSLFESIIG